MNEREALLAATCASVADLAALRGIMAVSGLSSETIDELIIDDGITRSPSLAAEMLAGTADVLKGVLGFGVERCCFALGIAGASAALTMVLLLKTTRTADRLAVSAIKPFCLDLGPDGAPVQTTA